MDTSKLTSTLLHRGAEADLSLSTVGPWKVVVKRRVRKEYRNPTLDEQIRRDRTISEASRIHEAKVAGARVSSIVGVDLDLLQRSIVASHNKDASSMMNAMIRGYEQTAGKKVAGSTARKAREIARRGRYFAIR